MILPHPTQTYWNFSLEVGGQQCVLAALQVPHWHNKVWEVNKWEHICLDSVCNLAFPKAGPLICAQGLCQGGNRMKRRNYIKNVGFFFFFWLFSQLSSNMLCFFSFFGLQQNAKVNIMGVVCLAAWNKSERGVKWIHTPHVQARQESSWTGGLSGCDRVSEVGLGLWKKEGRKEEKKERREAGREGKNKASSVVHTSAWIQPLPCYVTCQGNLAGGCGFSQLGEQCV